MNHPRSHWPAVLVAVLALAIAACGDSDGAATTAPPATTSSTAPATSVAPTTTSSSRVTTTEGMSLQTVQVAFATADTGDCSEVTLFSREIDAGLDPVVAAFELLVAGPNSEEIDLGAGSFFSGETSEMVRSVVLEEGFLTVDFDDFRAILNNASTSCGSMSLLAQLNATAFQFVEVERARYEIEGSCDLFSNWLQRECMEYTRAGAEPAQP